MEKRKGVPNHWSVFIRMGLLVLAIIPIVVLYLACQKYIISGVMAGAVKG